MKKMLFLAILFAVGIQAEQVIENNQEVVVTMPTIEEQRAQMLEFQQRVSAALFDAIREMSISFYEKNWNDILWLEKNYINDIEAGDILIDKLVIEFTPIMEALITKAPDMILNDPLLKSPSIDIEAFKYQFENTLRTSMEPMIKRSLRENAIVRSTVQNNLFR